MVGDMNPLLSALQGWSGPVNVERILGELGFSVPSRYWIFCKEACDEMGIPNDFDVFWRESALEFMSSGGLAKKSYRGRFADRPGFYRSDYLDRLDVECKEHALRNSTKYFGAVHPFLYNLALNREMAERFGRDLRSFIEAEKLKEINGRFDASHSLSNQTDVVHYLIEAGEFLGADRFNINELQPFMSDNGLKFDCGQDLMICLGCDLGGPPMVRKPPIKTFIYHKSWHDDLIYIVGFDFFMPNIAVYSSFQTHHSCVLGIYALVAAAKALAASFQLPQSL